MTTTDQPTDHVSVTNTMASEDSPETDQLSRLYKHFEREHLNPLWTQRDSLMPTTPAPSAVPFVWKWSTLYPLAQRAGDLVPVGRGGERRAIALANTSAEAAHIRMHLDRLMRDSAPRGFAAGRFNQYTANS